MQLELPASLARGANVLWRTALRAFPTPVFLMPPSAGIDISDASIKWLVLAPDVSGYRVETYGEEPLPAGIVVEGTIKDSEALSHALREVRKRLGKVSTAHAALPEESGYLFEMHIPEGVSHDQAMKLIEFEFEGRVPISPEAAVFDFDSIEKHDDDQEEIGISVFPRELAESYVAAFRDAGFTLLSLEFEARSIARAVSPPAESGVVLLVDFGRERTGFAVLKHGIPIFSSTVEIGGEEITRTLKEKLSLSPEDAVKFRNEQGLTPDEGNTSAGLDAIAGTASALSDEIARYYHYWDTRRDEKGERMTPVSKVLLVGGSANLKGLVDYVAGRVQAPTALGDVWQRVYDFNRSVPPIDRRTSLKYATAVGLALRSFV